MGLAVQCNRCRVFASGEDVALEVNTSNGHWWAKNGWEQLQYGLVSLCPDCSADYKTMYEAFMTERGDRGDRPSLTMDKTSQSIKQATNEYRGGE